MEGLAPTEKVVWSEHFPGLTAQGADILGKLLLFHPDHRITVEEALAHEYFSNLHLASQELESEQLFNWDWEMQPMATEALKELVFQEFKALHPEWTWSPPLISVPNDSPSFDPDGPLAPGDGSDEACLEPSLEYPPSPDSDVAEGATLDGL